jgi:hypothetical protein
MLGIDAPEQKQAFGTKSKEHISVQLPVSSWLWNTVNETVMHGFSVNADYENKASLYLVNQWRISLFCVNSD